MHIAIFVDYHPQTIGGIPSSITAQREALEKQGHKVTIFCPELVDKPTHPDPAIIGLPYIPYLVPNGFPFVFPGRKIAQLIDQAVKKLDPIDVVHVQSDLGIGILGVQFARKHKLPLVQTMHGREDIQAEKLYPIPPVTSWMLKKMHQHYLPHTVVVPRGNSSLAAWNLWQLMVNHAQQADIVTVPSEHFKQQIVERGLTKPTVPISNGLDDSVLAIAAKATVRRLGDRPLKLMWCSRMSAEKRPLACVEAAALMPDCRVDMFGTGPEESVVLARIKELKLEDRVHLKKVNGQKEVVSTMLGYDALIFTSHGFDTQAIVLLEAAATGLPVIYCDPNLATSTPAGGAVLTKNPNGDGFADELKALKQLPQRLSTLSQAMLDHPEWADQATFTKAMVEQYSKAIGLANKS